MAVDLIVFISASELSCIQLFATLWTIAPKAPLSMEFPRQEYWSELPFLPLGSLLIQKLNSDIVLRPLRWQTNSLPLCLAEALLPVQFLKFFQNTWSGEVLIYRSPQIWKVLHNQKTIGLTSCHFHDFCFFSRRCLVVCEIIHNKLRFLRGGTGVLSAPGSCRVLGKHQKGTAARRVCFLLWDSQAPPKLTPPWVLWGDGYMIWKRERVAKKYTAKLVY